MGKYPLINGITSTETLCDNDFEENVMTSKKKNNKYINKQNT